MKAIDVACMLIYVGLTEFNPRQLKQNATGMSLHATNWHLGRSLTRETFTENENNKQCCIFFISHIFL